MRLLFQCSIASLLFGACSVKDAWIDDLGRTIVPDAGTGSDGASASDTRSEVSIDTDAPVDVVEDTAVEDTTESDTDDALGDAEATDAGAADSFDTSREDAEPIDAGDDIAVDEVAEPDVPPVEDDVPAEDVVLPMDVVEGPPATLELGTLSTVEGQLTFTPWEDGATQEIVSGFQGAIHLNVAARITTMVGAEPTSLAFTCHTYQNAVDDVGALNLAPSINLVEPGVSVISTYNILFYNTIPSFYAGKATTVGCKAVWTNAMSEVVTVSSAVTGVAVDTVNEVQ